MGKRMDGAEETFLNRLWRRSGKTDSARRRNWFIILVLFFGVVSYGFYCKAITIAISRIMGN